MTVQKDSKENPYVSVECRGAHIRLTYVEFSSAWEGEVSTVRIQTQHENGLLMQGPEIPVDVLPKITGALLELIAANKESAAISMLLSQCSKG